MRGQVSLQWLGRWIYIQDSSQGLFIPSTQKTPLHLGEMVDVVGFPAVGEYSLMLEDAIFRRESSARALAAAPVTAVDALRGDYDARLIQLTGRLVNQDLTSNSPALVMSSGHISFFALLPEGTKFEEVASLRPGSELQLTGVCSVQVDRFLSSRGQGGALPVSFRLLLRSTRDVAVLQTPSWWTVSRIFTMLTICLVITLVCTLWVIALRRRVIERTETLRAALESTADGLVIISTSDGGVAHNQKFVTMFDIPQSLVVDWASILRLQGAQVKDEETFFSKTAATNAGVAQIDDVLEFRDGRRV